MRSSNPIKSPFERVSKWQTKQFVHTERDNFTLRILFPVAARVYCMRCHSLLRHRQQAPHHCVCHPKRLAISWNAMTSHSHQSSDYCQIRANTLAQKISQPSMRHDASVILLEFWRLLLLLLNTHRLKNSIKAMSGFVSEICRILSKIRFNIQWIFCFPFWLLSVTGCVVGKRKLAQ